MRSFKVSEMSGLRVPGPEASKGAQFRVLGFRACSKAYHKVDFKGRCLLQVRMAISLATVSRHLSNGTAHTES